MSTISSSRRVSTFLRSISTPVGHLEVAEVGGDAHVAHHRAADERDAALVRVGGVEHLLDAVHVRRERRDDDPLGRVARTPGPARDRSPAPGATNPGTSALVESTMNRSTPSLAEPRERAQVGDPAVERQLVHLEVAGVQHGAGGGVHGHGERVGDGVVHGDELALEPAERRGLPLAHLARHGLDAVLLELRLDERERQPASRPAGCPCAAAAGTARRRCGPRGRA